MEYIVGNPSLKPSRDTEHTLRLSYNDDRWSAFAEGFYRHCNKPNMAHYERTADDKFIYTQINQKAINVLNTMAYASYWITPEKLQIYANGGMMRCFNYGFDYTHCYTSWFYSAGVTAYLGKFTLLAFADNGFRFVSHAFPALQHRPEKGFFKCRSIEHLSAPFPSNATKESSRGHPSVRRGIRMPCGDIVRIDP